MLKSECKVPIYQGDKPTDVVYQASAGSGEADLARQERELPIALNAEHERGTDGRGQRGPTASHFAIARNWFPSKEKATATATS